MMTAGIAGTEVFKTHFVHAINPKLELPSERSCYKLHVPDSCKAYCDSNVFYFYFFMWKNRMEEKRREGTAKE